MTHVAKRFGISDVALRKTCLKHAIPTPPLGYWAKLAHGNPVDRPLLPSQENGAPDAIYLTERPEEEVPSAVAAARSAATDKETAPEAKIVIPRERPEKLHHTAISVERVLRKAKADHEGFISCTGPGLVPIKISPATLERTILLIDTFLKALPQRNFQITDDDSGVAISFEEEIFYLSVQESRDRTPHEPTTQELKAQAERDSWRSQFPDLYSSDWKVYRKWDHFPSGRLSFELVSKGWNRWSKVGHVGRWSDRSTKRAEEYFNASIVALISTTAQIKHDRAIETERARREAEEIERRRKEREKQERAKKRREFLISKAKEYADLTELVALQNHLKAQTNNATSEEPVDRLAKTLNELVEIKAQELSRDHFNSEISRLKLFTDDDLNESGA